MATPAPSNTGRTEMNPHGAIERAPKARAGVIHAFGSLFAGPAASRKRSSGRIRAPINDLRSREYSVRQAV